VIYSTLMILGLFLRESSQQLTIIWPARRPAVPWRSGFRPRRNWRLDRGTQMALEIAIDFSRVDHFTLRTYGPFIVANSLDGIVGALIAGPTHGDSGNSPDSGMFCSSSQRCARRRGKRRSSARLVPRSRWGAARYFREWQLWWRGTGWDPYASHRC